MNSEVSALGYVVITAADVGAWQEFAESVLGLQVAAHSDLPSGEAVYLRADERSWRIAVEQGEDGGLAALGFEVADAEALERLKVRLENNNVPVKEAPELAAYRKVLGLLQATDPNGVSVEFFYGARTEQQPFVSKRGAKFVTGAQGLGHAVLAVGELDETYEFYVTVLGFRLSDIITTGPLRTYFTSPNARHHSLAFGGAPGMPVRLQHIMLQVADVDTVGRALDRVYDGDTALAMGLGRHSNDRMLSFYCSSPSGLMIEYGWDGLEVDDATHTVGYYEAASFWGHRLLDGTDPTKMMLAAMQSQQAAQ